ncbi:NAD(P)-binding domain-containing protein [Mycobacterium sp. 21AC1]|uniref:NAD(P)-dependent oxidoreductase n=1 Tax=[Mycobacterium] appelbergii TaxID=2939269 RepID=UPI002938D141|nr:NAD(P)-binding domain-containing protein [Mycobacterium sp. 21AC1]MDV3125830.1 NAD(P)-binding domain-containing protein [Mycobacterium sp. 21AC1]
MSKVAVVGLGEAGALYARGLRDAGFDVAGYDPFTRLDEPGIAQYDGLADAVAGVDLVITLVGAGAARKVTGDVLAHAAAGTLLADFNTGGPELKATLAEAAGLTGVRFVDVAVLAPVPRAGARTPLMVSGAHAEAFVELFAPTGAPVEAIGGEPGDAASRKLIRSVFMKGLAAVVLESVGAAEAAGCERWLRDQIADELSGDACALIDRLIDGSRAHAARRIHEVTDARDYLESIDQPAWTMQAARSWLSSLDGTNA